MPRCSIPWVFNYYMQKKKKQGRSLLKPYSFRCKRSIHALFGKYTIPYHHHNDHYYHQHHGRHHHQSYCPALIPRTQLPNYLAPTIHSSMVRPFYTWAKICFYINVINYDIGVKAYFGPCMTHNIIGILFSMI